MRKDERTRFVVAVTALTAVYGRKMDETAIDGWWEALHDLEVGDVEEACRRLARESIMAPFPAHVRAACGASEERAALEGWRMVIEHIRSGYKLDVPPAVEKAVAMLGGWSHLGGMDSGKLHTFGRKDFLSLYGHACADVRQKQLATTAEQARIEATGGDPNKRVDCTVEMPTLRMFPKAGGAGRRDRMTMHAATYLEKAARAEDAQRLVVLDAVKESPGRTERKLEVLFGIDLVVIQTRLPELRESGMVMAGATRVCKVARHQRETWVATAAAWAMTR